MPARPSTLLMALLPCAAIPVALLTVPASPAQAAPVATVSFVERSAGSPQTDANAAVTAVGLKSGVAAAAPASRIVVLFDTSASQTGDYRRRGLDALAGLMENARPEDRFAVAAVDVACTPLTDGFLAAADGGIKKAVRGLDARTPLGSTDLVAALDAAAKLLETAPGPRAVVYIGDGPASAASTPRNSPR